MSQVYEQILDILKSTTCIEDPEGLLEGYCREMNKTPAEVHHEDSGQIILLLMKDVNNSIIPSEWEQLDEAFKKMMTDPGVNRNKIKGVVLSGVLDYLGSRLGQGKIGTLRNSADLPLHINLDGWYPFSLLEDLLSEAEKRLPVRNGYRSRSIGKYIISKKNLEGADYLFGNKTPSEIVAIWNIDKMVSLEGLTLTEMDLGNIEITFKGNCSEETSEFLKGLMDGIFKLRGKALTTNSLESKEPELNLMVICYE